VAVIGMNKLRISNKHRRFESLSLRQPVKDCREIPPPHTPKYEKHAHVLRSFLEKPDWRERTALAAVRIDQAVFSGAEMSSPTCCSTWRGSSRNIWGCWAFTHLLMQSGLQRISAFISEQTREFCPFFAIFARQVGLRRTDYLGGSRRSSGVFLRCREEQSGSSTDSLFLATAFINAFSSPASSASPGK